MASPTAQRGFKETWEAFVASVGRFVILSSNTRSCKRLAADADGVRHDASTSLGEARANGALNAEYAQEWATYLEANACAYNDGC